MRPYLLTVAATFLVVLPVTVWGSVRTIGQIETAGLVSENALDVYVLLDHFVLLDHSQWDAVVSSDGGCTWRFTERAQLPKTLAKLPTQGEIRYQIVDKHYLLRSNDSGGTWTDVSPRQIRFRAIRDDVDTEKKRFLAKYGHWLPESEAWPFAFAGAAAVLLSIGGWYSRKLRGKWLTPVLLSFAAYCLFGLVLFAAHEVFIQELLFNQWTARLGHWDNGVSFPNWPLGLFLHLSGNGWIAPLTAAVLFPATPLWGYILSSQSRAGAHYCRDLASCIPVLCLLILLVVSSIPGIGRGWGYGVEPLVFGQKDGPTKGSPLIRAGTNAISEAACPRR